MKRILVLLGAVLPVALGACGGSEESDPERGSTGSRSGTPGQSDGGVIAFTRSDGGFDDRFGEIYVMNADGSDQTNLTDSPRVSEAAPAWSPDGTQLAFVRFEDKQESDIYARGPTSMSWTPAAAARPT